jgi:hypothetical protein
MPIPAKNRVAVTSTTTGAGPFTLGSALTAHKAFTIFSNGTEIPYAIIAVDGSGTPTGDWETGTGTVSSSGTVLTRTTVTASSNADAVVNFAAGTKYVFCSINAELFGTIACQESDAVAITGGAIDGTVIGSATPDVGTFTTIYASVGSEAVSVTNDTITYLDGGMPKVSLASGGTDFYFTCDASVTDLHFDVATAHFTGAVTADGTITGKSGFNLVSSPDGIVCSIYDDGAIQLDGYFGRIFQFNSPVTVNEDLTVTGDLVVNGDVFDVFTASMRVEDPLVKFGQGNAADSVDLGFYVTYKPVSTQLYGGLFRDASDGIWKLYDLSQSEPTTTVNIAATGYIPAPLSCGDITITSYNNSYFYNQGGGNVLTLDALADDPATEVFRVQYGGAIKSYSDGNGNVCAAAVTQATAAGLIVGRDSTKISFYEATPIFKPSGDIITALGNLGLIASPTVSATALTGIVPGANGGTGVANTGKTITVSGNTTIGSSTHTVAFVTSANTSVTLPTTGTLATLAGSETLTNKTLTAPVLSGVKYSTVNQNDSGNSGTSKTIDFAANGNRQKVAMTGNCTFTFTPPASDAVLYLKLTQDATGSRTVAWPGTVKWSGGVAPTLSTAANAVDIVTLVYDAVAGHYYAQCATGFA